MPKAIVLIAEDDVNLSEILKTKLSALDYEVFVAHNGEEAEKIILEHKPDVSLLDIMMPKKSGMEVLETMVKNQDIKDLPVFMLSNLGQKKDIDHAMSLGAKDYIVKANVSLAQIVDKIDQYLKANPPKERPVVSLKPAEPAKEEKTAAAPASQAAISTPVSGVQTAPRNVPAPTLTPAQMPASMLAPVPVPVPVPIPVSIPSSSPASMPAFPSVPVISMSPHGNGYTGNGHTPQPITAAMMPQPPGQIVYIIPQNQPPMLCYLIPIGIPGFPAVPQTGFGQWPVVGVQNPLPPQTQN